MLFAKIHTYTAYLNNILLAIGFIVMFTCNVGVTLCTTFSGQFQFNMINRARHVRTSDIWWTYNGWSIVSCTTVAKWLHAFPLL